MVEERPRPKFNRPKRQNPKTKPNSSNNVQNPTFEKIGSCLVCGKPRHHAPQCRIRKRLEKVNPRENLTEAEVIGIVVSSKVSMVFNMEDWIVHSMGH